MQLEETTMIQSTEYLPDGIWDGHVMLLNVLFWQCAPAKHQRPFENTPLEAVNKHVTEEE